MNGRDGIDTSKISYAAVVFQRSINHVIYFGPEMIFEKVLKERHPYSSGCQSW